VGDERHLLRRLAEAVADADPIDWPAVQRSGARGAPAELARLARLFAPADGRAAVRPRLGGTSWSGAVEWLAGLQAVAGLVGLGIASLTAGPALQKLFAAGLVLAFGGAALALRVGGGEDRRARDLGAFFLVVAAAFSFPLPVPPPVGLLRRLPADAFLPWLLCRFLREFPRSFRLGRVDVFLARYTTLSARLGATLFLVQPLLAALPGAGAGALGRLARGHPSGAYWAVLFALCLPALVSAPWRARAAEPGERRRVRVLLAGLALGASPIVVDVLVQVLYPPAFRRLAAPEARIVAALVHFLFLLVVPLSAAYAVLVEHVLDLRLAVRAATRHALARYTLLALTALPSLALGVFLYRHRRDTLEVVFSGGQARLLAGTAVVALVLLRLRERLTRAFDRLWLPGHADAQQALAALAEGASASRSGVEVARLLAEELRRGILVESVSVLVDDGSSGRLLPVDGPARPLGRDSAIVSLLADDPSVLEVDPRTRRSFFPLLPEEERQWVVDGNAAVVLPLGGAAGSLSGLVAVGPKLSDLGFSREDRLFLSSMAASASLALQSRLSLSNEGAGPGWSDEPARQCEACGALGPASETACGCGGERRLAAAVPYLLCGKFRMERLLGRGGMGLVFRAFDVDLHRWVAVKTLPRVSAEASSRLRREARAMAAFTHPHLALIYGAESWRGTPLLIVEYLPGGTLADRLPSGSLPLAEALHLVGDLAAALEAVHGAGLLHRDVKPSNIGFAEGGTPKLLDFGLARWAGSVTESTPEGSALPRELAESLTESRGVVGTPLYLPPEALAGAPADPSFDVWALCVVLYECLTGLHPFRAESLPDLIARIGRGAAPIRSRLPECPVELAELLEAALAPRRENRPSTMAELRRALARCDVHREAPATFAHLQ
jgi:protein kinase-like protein